MRGSLAIFFLTVGIAKLYGIPEFVQLFERLGVGPWLRYLVGTAEIAGATALFTTYFVALGAFTLFGVSVGAFFTQMFILRGDPVHAIVLAALAAVVLWPRRDEVVRFLGDR
ncbi:MAG TPA: DoxX family protein [Usitatibacter sp.]|nr:DoxX family protein [Usitatibacter sp.]